MVQTTLKNKRLPPEICCVHEDFQGVSKTVWWTNVIEVDYCMQSTLYRLKRFSKGANPNWLD